MAFTKVLGPGIHTQANIHSHNINSSGIITATKFVGPITGGGGDFNAGIVTCTTLDVNGNADISGNLVVHGDTTTLNTTLREVELLHVDANSSVAAGIITQRGSGDILNLFDTTTEVFTVLDGGKVGINTTVPAEKLSVSVAGNQRENFAKFEHIGQQNFFIQGQWGDKDIGGANGTLLYGSGTVALRAATSGNAHLVNLANGNIGIGSVSPGRPLTITHADPRIRLQDSDSGGFAEIYADNNNDLHLTADASLSAGGSKIIFNVDGTGEKMRITSDGNIAQGVAGSATFSAINSIAANAARGIEIFKDGTDTGSAIKLAGDNGSGTKAWSQLGFSGANATAHWANYNTAGQKVGEIQIGSSGNIGIGDRTSSPDADLHVHTASGESTIHVQAATNANLNLRAHSGDSTVKFSDGSASNVGNINYDHATDSLSFRVNASTRLTIDSNGHITPDDANTYDLGSTSKEFRNLYIGNSGRVYLGDAQEVSLYHDGNNTYLVGGSDAGLMQVKNLGGGDVECFSNHGVKLRVNGGENAVVCNHNSSVDLYFDGGTYSTPKLKTSHYGVTVDGEVAASQDYPKYQPSLDFNFARVKKLDSRFTFTRTGPASYIDENGYVQLVGPNVPRFDHDPVTKESKGLLTEQSCANWIKYGTDLSGTGWGTNNVTHTLAPSVVGPDGKTGGVYESKENSSSAYHASHYQSSIPVTSGQYYTVSSWVKKGPNYRTDINGGKFQFYCSRGTGTVAYVSIDPTFTSITNHSNTNTRSITQYPNGWVKVTYSFTSNQNAGNVIPHWLHGNGGSYSGNGASSVYIWGCQFEQMRFPTSYVPTNGSVVFRGTDDVTLDGTEFTDVFNPNEGTSVVYAHMPNENGAAGLPAYTFKNTSNSNITLGLSRDNNASPAYHYYNDGSNSGFSRSSATGDNMYKGAMSFKTSDFDSYVNGSLNSNTTTFTMPTIDHLRIGGISGANYLGGHTARFMYYPVKLTNNQLMTLTS